MRGGTVKKDFEPAEFNVIRFDSADVIVTSGETKIGPGSEDQNEADW